MFVVVVAISLRLFLVLFVVVYVVAEFPLGLSMEVAQFFASGVVPPSPRCMVFWSQRFGSGTLVHSQSFWWWPKKYPLGKKKLRKTKKKSLWRQFLLLNLILWKEEWAVNRSLNPPSMLWKSEFSIAIFVRKWRRRMRRRRRCSLKLLFLPSFFRSQFCSNWSSDCLCARARVPRTNCFGERIERSIVCCKQTVRGSGVPIEWFGLFSAKHGAKSELALLLGLISLALQNVRRINLRPGWMLQNLLMNLPCREN